MTRPDTTSRLHADTDHAADIRGERPTYAEVLAQIARDDDAANAPYQRQSRIARAVDVFVAAAALFAVAWFGLQALRWAL